MIQKTTNPTIKHQQNYLKKKTQTKFCYINITLKFILSLYVLYMIGQCNFF
jgi:hypothetical protein